MLIKFPKPLVVVSQCLGFEACRPDGELFRSQSVEKLSRWVDFIQVCPELSLGLGVPRDPMRVETHENGLRFMQQNTARDLTQDLEQFASGFLDDLPEVDGFIMKSRSPSCGLRDIAVYAGSVPVQAGTRATSLLGELIASRFPNLPREDEGRLTNYRLREHFLAWLFAHAELREARKVGTLHALIQFHARHKYQLMACSPKRSKELGHIVANHDQKDPAEVFSQYEEALGEAMKVAPRLAANVNVLTHCMGYFSKELSGKEKRYFLETLEDYKERKVPISVPVALLRSWIVRFGEPYLEGQSYFSPYPEELASVVATDKRRKPRKKR